MAIGVGSLISVAVHGGLLAGVMLILGQPRPFETRPQEAIAVDLVTPKDVAKEVASVPAEKDETPPAEQQAKPQATPKPEAEPQMAASPPPAPSAQAAAQPPPQAADSSSGPMQLFAPSAELLTLYNMRAPSAFDAAADTKANLTGEEVAQMRAHLRRCWRLPPELSASSARVVLRLFLSADGALAGEPMLIEASASRDGPQVMQAAMQAVEQCQPFAFLPRERYGEWKQIDISFSPGEMGG